ncbi:MAG TPA: hypothetical protein VEU97_10915 [Ktedonobacteraceae bacterium]|nr:hypothetical protein [Ktedonobacteraceae bacterium]
MAYQAKLYGGLNHNLYHLAPLYKRAKKDVGKNQLLKRGMNGPTFRGVMGWGPALALRQFAEPTEPLPYQRYTRTIPEYGQSLAYLAE